MKWLKRLWRKIFKKKGKRKLDPIPNHVKYLYGWKDSDGKERVRWGLPLPANNKYLSDCLYGKVYRYYLELALTFKYKGEDLDVGYQLEWEWDKALSIQYPPEHDDMALSSLTYGEQYGSFEELTLALGSKIEDALEEELELYKSSSPPTVANRLLSTFYYGVGEVNFVKLDLTDVGDGIDTWLGAEMDSLTSYSPDPERVDVQLSDLNYDKGYNDFGYLDLLRTALEAEYTVDYWLEQEGLKFNQDNPPTRSDKPLSNLEYGVGVIDYARVALEQSVPGFVPYSCMADEAGMFSNQVPPEEEDLYLSELEYGIPHINHDALSLAYHNGEFYPGASLNTETGYLYVNPYPPPEISDMLLSELTYDEGEFNFVRLDATRMFDGGRKVFAYCLDKEFDYLIEESTIPLILSSAVYSTNYDNYLSLSLLKKGVRSFGEKDFQTFLSAESGVITGEDQPPVEEDLYLSELEDGIPHINHSSLVLGNENEAGNFPYSLLGFEFSNALNNNSRPTHDDIRINTLEYGAGTNNYVRLVQNESPSSRGGSLVEALDYEVSYLDGRSPRPPMQLPGYFTDIVFNEWYSGTDAATGHPMVMFNSDQYHHPVTHEPSGYTLLEYMRDYELYSLVPYYPATIHIDTYDDDPGGMPSYVFNIWRHFWGNCLGKTMVQYPDARAAFNDMNTGEMWDGTCGWWFTPIYMDIADAATGKIQGTLKWHVRCEDAMHMDHAEKSDWNEWIRWTNMEEWSKGFAFEEVDSQGNITGVFWATAWSNWSLRNASWNGIGRDNSQNLYFPVQMLRNFGNQTLIRWRYDPNWTFDWWATPVDNPHPFFERLRDQVYEVFKSFSSDADAITAWKGALSNVVFGRIEDFETKENK